MSFMWKGTGATVKKGRRICFTHPFGLMTQSVDPFDHEGMWPVTVPRKPLSTWGVGQTRAVIVRGALCHAEQKARETRATDPQDPQLAGSSNLFGLASFIPEHAIADCGSRVASLVHKSCKPKF